MTASRGGAQRRVVGAVKASTVAVIAVVALTAVLATIGADARWLAAFGQSIVDLRGLPDGVPYATAPSDGWPNVLVVAELVFWALDALAGDRGLVVAQLVALAAGFAALGATCRRGGASDAGTAAVLLMVAIGALSSLVVVRVQLFSLLLFPVLLALLHAETRAPSRRIWLLVPLVAAWSNLHGAVLVGLAVAGAYLLVHRARKEPLTAVAVLAASSLALGLTPALARTPEYYFGVLENEAARRGAGLWAALSPTSPFDLLLVAAAATLVVFALRGRPAAWELVASLGLALLTIRTARSGVWLLVVLAVPAARGLRLSGELRPRVATALTAGLLVSALLAIGRGPLETAASREAVGEAVERAEGTPILAEPLVAEQIVLAGGHVWLANPLDAFRPEDQALYLDWLEGDSAILSRVPRVVVVRRGSDAEAAVLRVSAFRPIRTHDGHVTYLRR